MKLDDFDDFVMNNMGDASLESFPYWAISLGGEAGEVLNKLKKVIRDNNGVIDEIKKKELMDELGDVLFCATAACLSLGITLEDAVDVNMRKITRRVLNNTIRGSGDDR